MNKWIGRWTASLLCCTLIISLMPVASGAHEECNYVEVNRDGADCIGYYVEYECEECGDSYDDFIEPTEDHDYQESYREVSCEWGYIEYTCTKCEDSYSVDIEGTGGHDYQESARESDTFWESGYVEYTCTYCADSYEEELKPIEIPAGTLRIVLTWANKPSDLDSVLTGPGAKQDCHVEYYQMSHFDEVTMAELDRDDTDFQGPETILLYPAAGKGIYSFHVHDFSNGEDENSRAMSRSGARVTISIDNVLVAEFHVPRNLYGT